MDLSNDGTNSRAQDTSGTGTLEGRPSVEARQPQTPRLQKKRSNAGVDARRRQTTGPSTTPRDDLAETREGNKARKGSIRNAVRRIFGRRSRETEPQPAQVSPPGHGYHGSEPSALTPQPEIPEGIVEEEDFAPRTFSAPFALAPSAIQRTRSPYAVEFPRSARLKPLNLGDPFSAPGSQLRRRKTLPSVLITESDAATISAALQPDEALAGPSFEPSRAAPLPNIGSIARTSRSEKRKSRSADDLKVATAERSSLSRKRSEDIRYWRESLQGTVLRASGFRVPSPREDTGEDVEGERTPLAQMSDPFDNLAGPSGFSPRPGGDVGQIDVGSPSALGSQLSQDLEDRVARLEAGLRNFQGELTRIAAERNRRTVRAGGGAPSGRRASSGGRTASMLAETLQFDLEPTSYQYDYSGLSRPSTSPRTPTRFADPSVAVPAIPVHTRTSSDPFTSSPPIPPASSMPPSGGGNEASQPQVPQYTFRSLYEMLTDERSARRRLEIQMRNLRDEISHLNYQVSHQSNVQSQRSSYYAAMDPMVGTSRLHALLAETEESPPGTRNSPPQRESASTRFSGEQQQQPVVSRFSGSESEIGTAGDPEELFQTPYEAYQTPAEERGGMFPFGEQGRREGGMF